MQSAMGKKIIANCLLQPKAIAQLKKIKPKVVREEYCAILKLPNGNWDQGEVCKQFPYQLDLQHQAQQPIPLPFELWVLQSESESGCNHQLLMKYANNSLEARMQVL